MPPLSEQQLTLLAGRSTPKDEPLQMPACQLELVVRVGGREVRASPERVRDVESNGFRRVELRRARIGDTGLVAELLVTAWRDQRYADVSAAVFFSDPDSPDMQRRVDELAVECRGMAMVCRHSGYLGVRQRTTPYGSLSLIHI